MSPDRSILVVDDDEGVCRLLSGALKKDGLASRWVTSGAEAIEWLRNNDPAVILLDLHLADMKGQEVLSALNAEGRQIPFIVISGVSDIRVAVKLMQEGALDFLPKDTQLLDLVAPIVRRCLDRLDQQRRLAEAESRFLQLAENIQSLFWIATPDMGRFLYLSPAYEHLWGLPVESAYERPASWLEAVLSADLPALQSALERLKINGESVEVEFRLPRTGGGMRWLHCTASALRSTDGRIERLTGLVRDVTERKEIDRRILATAEQERRRLGQDLHDDLCQRLAAIKLRCGMHERNLIRDGSSRAQEAAELAVSIAEATALSRSFAGGLAPVALDTDGLVSALEVLTKSAATIFGVSVRFECRTSLAVSDPDISTHLYRIAQELISNAAKHARPSRILVNLEQQPDRLLLGVENDGTSFNGDSGSGGGMGLHFLRSRTDAIGATLTFTPGDAPQGGTRALCILPTTSPAATP
jgi:PAS domain S-box-containing protein